MRRTIASAALLVSAAFSFNVEARIFDNDTFKISQEASDSFGFFVNGTRSATLTGSGDLSATFTQAELINLLLPNNGLSSDSLANSSFFKFIARDLAGLMDVSLSGGNVQIIFDRSIVTDEVTGKASLKYNRPGGSDRNFVTVVGEALSGGGDTGGGDTGGGDTGGGDTTPPVVVIPGGGDGGSVESGGSRGGSGPFFNDEFTITKTGDAFSLELNGVELTSIADSGGDLMFNIPENTFKALILANNGVSGRFLGDGTEFFDFLAKGNAGLIDVTLGDNIGFKIDRDFVLNEQSGESVFKYDADGKKARNFINFVGVVDPASPSS